MKKTLKNIILPLVPGMAGRDTYKAARHYFNNNLSLAGGIGAEVATLLPLFTGLNGIMEGEYLLGATGVAFGLAGRYYFSIKSRYIEEEIRRG